MTALEMEEPIDIDLPKSLHATRKPGRSPICASPARRSATRSTITTVLGLEASSRLARRFRTHSGYNFQP